MRIDNDDAATATATATASVSSQHRGDGSLSKQNLLSDGLNATRNGLQSIEKVHSQVTSDRLYGSGW
jgi:hypothetical protein